MKTERKRALRVVLSYCIVASFGFIAFMICIYFDLTLYGVIIVSSIVGLPFVKLISNPSLDITSSRAEIASSSQPSKSNVNENISRFNMALKTKKEKAKWWQFWI